MSTDFRRLPLFADVPEEDLDRLYRAAEPISIRTDELLIEEGSLGNSLFVIVEGEFEVTKRAGEQELIITRRGPGEVLGEIALLDGQPRTATVRALADGRVLKVGEQAFYDLLASSPPATKAILHAVAARLRDIESTLMQHEKMAALGGLAAGIAHELNNPAAAVRRNADHLRESLDEWQSAIAGVHALGRDDGHAERLRLLEAEMLRRAGRPLFLDPLLCSDREAELQAWLEEQSVAEAYELAPALVALGWDVDSLRELLGDLSPEPLAALLRWLGTGSSIYRLLDEVRRSAERISEVVVAVKQYSYLDQAPVQNVDVHNGLDNTLIILRHKIKSGVHVTRDYAPDLPPIEAYAGELNQVWTNLIDNAVDAMNGQGELTIRTYTRPGHVVVEILDSGPGIPPEVQAHLFEPFYTTKPMGKGTGLGLYMAYNTVQKHTGHIRVESRPGRTCFQVSLPLSLGRKRD